MGMLLPNQSGHTGPTKSSCTPHAEQVCAAYAALLQRFTHEHELTPRQVAETVICAVPTAAGRALRSALADLGWLRRDAVIPADVLDGPTCPASLRGPQRELARLAVFGLPGQGLSSRDRKRQDVYQRLCADIMSSSVDTASLEAVASRALNHPDVRDDPVLASMLRSFIAQRESALSVSSIESRLRAQQESSKVQRYGSQRDGCTIPTKEEILRTFQRFQGSFERFLAEFEESQAEATLQRMRDLRRKYPVHIAPDDLQRAEEQFDRLLKRAGAYRRQISELAERGAAAAAEGDETTAGWVNRRLEAIHALLPNLLGAPQLEELRARIDRSGERHEHREVARELVEQQRKVARKIKDLAGVIHRFHEVAERLPPEHNAYRRAEANYRRAVREISQLDTDWLSGLVIQLESLLDDLDDPHGMMQSQLDEFVGKVRAALNRLCREVREHQRSRKQQRGNGDGASDRTPPDGPPPEAA
jgi:hypothetical protein